MCHMGETPLVCQVRLAKNDRTLVALLRRAVVCEISRRITRRVVCTRSVSPNLSHKHEPGT